MASVPPEVARVLQQAVSREHGSSPRRHHYVPRFYLVRFSDQKGRLAAYDRTTRKLISARPEQLGFERDFYRLPENAGLPKYFLEEVLSLQEEAAAIAIDNVCRAGIVADKDRLTLAMHIAMQILRTPNTRRTVGESAEWSASIFAQIELGRRLEAGEFSADERELAEQAIKQLEDGSVRVGPAEDARVGIALTAFAEILEHLLGSWTWLVVLLSQPRFITTNQPVIMLGEPEPGSAATNVGVATALEIWFPLDPRRALVLTRAKRVVSPLLGLGDAHVRLINVRLALESARWIFYRPGTDPLRGLQVPIDPPKWFSRTIGYRDHPNGQVGEIIQTGVERPRVPNERLLSGRLLRAFRKFNTG